MSKKSEKKARYAANKALKEKWLDAYLDLRAIERLRDREGPTDLLHFARAMEAGETPAKYLGGMRRQNAKMAMTAAYGKSSIQAWGQQMANAMRDKPFLKQILPLAGMRP